MQLTARPMGTFVAALDVFDDLPAGRQTSQRAGSGRNGLRMWGPR